jgi:5-methyltetrahydropteroyltriglutamate--homocysteine methyltransferase
LPELAHCKCQQISIETAQSNLDCSVLSELRGKKIMVGCIDLSDMTIETPELVAQRIERALPFVDPENILLAPDCGMKYLPREVADGKMRAMARGAALLRAKYSTTTLVP